MLATVEILIAKTEAAVREQPPADASEAIKKVFPQRNPVDLLVPSALMKKDDPRCLVLEAPATEETNAAPLKTTTGLTFVLGCDALETNAGMNYAFVCVGRPVEGEDKKGCALKFYTDDKFLVTRAFGQTLLLDYANGRMADGNLVLVANSVKGHKETFKKNRSSEWKLDDGKLVSCRSGGMTSAAYALGLKVGKE